MEVPNLAVANVLGACVVNLAFLVVADLLQRLNLVCIGVIAAVAAVAFG